MIRTSARSGNRRLRSTLSTDAPPKNIEAERAVVASIFAAAAIRGDGGELLDGIRSQVHPNRFFDDAVRTIYEALLDLRAQGMTVNLLTVIDYMGRTHTADGESVLEKVGGRAIVDGLATELATGAAWESYAKLVLDSAAQREFWYLGQQLTVAALSGSPAELVEVAEAGLVKIKNAIRSPIGIKAAGIEFAPVPMSQLDPSVHGLNWRWEGFIADGHITLLTGLWKAGKTTLLAWLLHEMGDGGNWAGPIHPSKVLVISEESRTLWVRRRDEIEIGDHVHIANKPFSARATSGQWLELIRETEVIVRRHGFELVVLDTLAELSSLHNENEAGEMLMVLAPLQQITATGAAVLLVHHPRKGDAGEGQASRGSGALPGFVDVILELRRDNPANRDDRGRVLTTYSRFDETPPKIVLELGEDGYRAVGSPAQAKQSDRLAVAFDLLPMDETGLTVEQIRERWPMDGPAKPSERRLREDLERDQRFHRSGAGKKGDPYRYRRNSILAASMSIGAGIESLSGIGRADCHPTHQPGLSATT
jgi:hypothetical protein